MTERTLEKKTLYTGRIVSLEEHTVELNDGRVTRREVVRHSPAVAVVAEMNDGRFAFVRQFRKAVESRILEVVAGCVDPGEELEFAARRELREETGYEAVEIRRLGAVYPSPGYVDERIELYYARLAAEPVGHELDEDEEVELEIYTRDEVCAMILSEELCDAKTLSAWLLYERRIGVPATEEKS